MQPTAQTHTQTFALVYNGETIRTNLPLSAAISEIANFIVPDEPNGIYINDEFVNDFEAHGYYEGAGVYVNGERIYADGDMAGESRLGKYEVIAEIY